MRSARPSSRRTGYRPSRLRRSSCGAWPTVRPSTSCPSGPRTVMRPSLPRCARFGHGSRRERCTLANRIRAPKDMTEVMDLIRRLPTYIRLVWALLRDGRVPARQKLILVGIGGYLFFSIELLPAFVPVLGQPAVVAVAASVLAWEMELRRSEQDTALDEASTTS